MQLKPRSLLGELGSIFQENGFTGHWGGGRIGGDAMEVVSMEDSCCVSFWGENQNHVVGCFCWMENLEGFFKCQNG